MVRELAVAKKVLVTNLMHIGDIVFMTPFLHVLRKHALQAEISLLVDQKTADVVRYNPNIDQLLTIDKKGADNSVIALWRYSKHLRSYQFDVVINLHPNERCSFLAAFSGAKYKVGGSAKIFGWLFDQVLKFKQQPEIQIVDMYLDILNQLGISELSHLGVEMEGVEKEQRFADAFYHQNSVGPGDTLIGINIGGSWPTKRWHPEGFASVADHYIKHGQKVVLFGGAMDIPLEAEILKRMLGTPILATGKTTLLQLAALIKRCAVFVSGDSGPIHIAATQKVPLVAIFGPSDRRRFPPYAENKTIITTELECQPCGKQQCEYHSCMHNITPQHLITAVDRFLGHK